MKVQILLPYGENIYLWFDSYSVDKITPLIKFMIPFNSKALVNQSFHKIVKKSSLLGKTAL
ncbi:MAG TPA: hypothetical protein VKD08_11910 [Ignavibacteriaceae bacterium]|nr:hypothetical protein [Ignavibacteriaceae bacterium]